MFIFTLHEWFVKYSKERFNLQHKKETALGTSVCIRIKGVVKSFDT